MLERSLSASAVRARARRARQRAGIERDLRVRAPTRRLVAAMRLAARANGRYFPDDKPDVRTIEIGLQAIVDAFIERWIGPAKKPHA